MAPSKIQHLGKAVNKRTGFLHRNSFTTLKSNPTSAEQLSNCQAWDISGGVAEDTENSLDHACQWWDHPRWRVFLPFLWDQAIQDITSSMLGMHLPILHGRKKEFPSWGHDLVCHFYYFCYWGVSDHEWQRLHKGPRKNLKKCQLLFMANTISLVRTSFSGWILLHAIFQGRQSSFCWIKASTLWRRKITLQLFWIIIPFHSLGLGWSRGFIRTIGRQRTWPAFSKNKNF